MQKVLIVDDIEINRDILAGILSEEYETIEAANGEDALGILFSGQKPPDAVLLDINMPGIDGFEVLKHMKAVSRTDKVPVLFITASGSSEDETRGLSEGAVDFISKPFVPEVVTARLHNHIQLAKYRESLEMMVEEKSAELKNSQERILETLATIIEYRSMESGTHVRRCTELSRILVDEMLSRSEYRPILVEQSYADLIKAVALHDIGKVGIPDGILLKPGKLTEDEFGIIKSHTTTGSDIIASMGGNSQDVMYNKHCYNICRHHHERYDGKGYPDRLAGENIPLAARIVSVVDVYDALVNRRCYKEPMSFERATAIIRDGAGTQFDAGIVACFLRVVDKFNVIELELGETLENSPAISGE